MIKVPVGASIAHAYEFLFGRFFQIIGTAWVPALLYGLVYYANLTSINLTRLTPGHPPDGAMLATMAYRGLAAFAFFLVVRAVLGISLTQEALGVRKDMTLAHFVVGPRELRLFFGYLRFYIVFIAFYVAAIAVLAGCLFLARKFGSGLAPALAVHGTPIARIVALVIGIVAVISFVLSMLRLYFLLAPVASAEHRMRLSRAWALTHGSTLRIFIVYLGTFLPAMAALWAAAYYALGPGDVSALIQTFHNVKPGNPPPVAAFIGAHAPMLAVLSAVFVAIEATLLAGASAAAYRAVTGHEDAEPEDDALLVAPLATPLEDHAHHDEPGPHEDHHGDGGHSHEDHRHGGHDEGHGHGDPDHGHDEHGGGHGHEDHGHGDDSGGHQSNGHDAQGHDAHGHGDHSQGEHNDHAHDDRGHHSDADPRD
ncbi:MAG TPA: hypothetical protein VJ476_08930 [Rhizomicrobium sp.]|nr:hypothetical protein [Rhizomicrobium sp.]